MKKLFRIILFLLVSAVLIFTPQLAQAATNRRLVSTYKKMVHDYLYNFRQPVGSGNTCRPMAGKRPSDCLSLDKIKTVERLLASVNYYQISDPYLRRKKLLEINTNVYVLRKILMWYEEHNDITTYQPNATAAQNYTVVDDFNRLIADPINNLNLKLVGQPTQGDSLILALATNAHEISPGIYEYSIIGKPLIPDRDLSILYGYKLDSIGIAHDNTRLGAFRNNFSDAHPNWESGEEAVISQIIANANSLINFARKHHLSPRDTYIAQDAMTTAMAFVGPPSSGGVWRGAGLSVPKRNWGHPGYQFKVGSTVGEITTGRIPFVFNQSKLPESTRQVYSALDELSAAANSVLKQKRFNSSAITEQRLIEIVSRDFYITPTSLFPEMDASKGYWGFYDPRSHMIFVADEAFLAGERNALKIATHELFHKIRFENKLFFFEDYKFVDETINDYLTVDTLIQAENWSSAIESGYRFRGVVDTLAAKLKKVYPTRFITLQSAYDFLYTLDLQGIPYSDLDKLLLPKPGALSFTKELDNRLSRLNYLEKKLGETPVSQRGPIAKDIEILENSTNEFIRTY